MVSTDNPQTGILIGNLLIQKGLVTTEQVKEALDLQQKEGGKTFEILIRLGHLDKDGLHACLSQQPGVAAIELSRFRVDPALTELVPKEFALKQLVLPIDKLGKLLTVAMACPIDKDTIAELERITGLKVKGMLCRYDEISAAVEKHYAARDAQNAGGAMHTFQLPSTARPGTDTGANLVDRLHALKMLSISEYHARQFEESLAAGDLRAAVQRLGQDPGLSAYMLSVANSGAYGLPGEVDSLGMAASLLGVAGMKSLLDDARKAAPPPGCDLGALYATAERAGLIAAMLAKKSGKVDRSVAYTAAILRRLGAVALATLSPREYAKIDAGRTEAQRLEDEKAAVGMSHLEAGGRLAARWRLPDMLCHAAGAMVNEPEAEIPAVTLACAGALLAERGAKDGAAALEPVETLLQRLGISADVAHRETAKLLS
ncbi:MAG: HDOD domain-containing protein [Candidatus Hydrogenedens sp.]|nr:HDOD domain-containing protein [Candidatus Hydrogenedens sp.]